MSAGPGLPVAAVDEIEVKKALAAACAAAGSQLAWARAHGLTQSQVSDVLNSRRNISGPILTALGFRKVTRYVPVRRAGGADA